jgi:hypothetical protein
LDILLDLGGEHIEYLCPHQYNSSFSITSPPQSPLENGQYVWRTNHVSISLIPARLRTHIRQKSKTGNSPCNPTRHITHLARNKETPPAHLLTMPRQLFQIKELADRTAPAGKEHFMESPRCLACCESR